ncbi:MAG: hypothetical protein ACXW30_04335 [Micavibrio sp.]
MARLRRFDKNQEMEFRYLKNVALQFSYGAQAGMEFRNTASVSTQKDDSRAKNDTSLEGMPMANKRVTPPFESPEFKLQFASAGG